MNFLCGFLLGFLLIKLWPKANDNSGQELENYRNYDSDYNKYMRGEKHLGSFHDKS